MKIFANSGRSAAGGLILLAVLAGGIAASGPAAEAASGATITITAGGDRTTDTAVGGLAGVTFEVRGDASPEQCVTGASGQCTVSVDGGRAYTIAEIAPAPGGWYSDPTLGIGSLTSVAPAAYDTITTSKVNAGQQVNVPVAATNSASATTGRSGVWALSRNDPATPTVCGLRVGLLFDLSSSVTSPTNNLPQYKAAGTGFVNALRGTPASVGVYTFGTGAPAANTSGSNNATLAPTSVAASSGADAVNAKINGLGVPGGSYTNWDQGLWQIANSSAKYDVAIVLTDGDPTKYGPGGSGGPSSASTRFAEVENGIFSANALKARGTKVIAVGIGVSDKGSVANLSAISGPEENSDYYTTNFSQLQDVLKGIIAKNCNGTINVVKQVIPGSNQGDINAASPAPGWTFANSDPSGSAVTGESGGVSFDTGQSTTPTTVTETQQPGYTLVQQDGKNATCVNNTTGQPVTTTDTPDGFAVAPDPEGIISCTVYNQQPATDPDPASARVDKTWVINGKTYQQGDQDPDFRTLLNLSPVHPDGTHPNWGQVYDGYAAGDTVLVGELPSVPVGCKIDAISGDIGDHTLAAGLNTYHVTNTLTCKSRLTLVKEVDNPYPGLRTAPPEEWTLRADGSPSFFSGTTGVSSVIAPDTRYTLSESGVPGYHAHLDPHTTLADGAVGSWQCQQLQTPLTRGAAPSRGRLVFAGGDGTVTLPPGTDAECTLVNSPEPARLTLVKHVIDHRGGHASPEGWTLMASPRTREVLPTGNRVEGKSGSDKVTGVEISPGTPYLLAESGGKPGYKETGLECSGAAFRGHQVTAGPGDHVTCRFTNTGESRRPCGRGETGVLDQRADLSDRCRPGRPVVPVTG